MGVACMACLAWEGARVAASLFSAPLLLRGVGVDRQQLRKLQSIAVMSVLLGRAAVARSVAQDTLKKPRKPWLLRSRALPNVGRANCSHVRPLERSSGLGLEGQRGRCIDDRGPPAAAGQPNRESENPGGAAPGAQAGGAGPHAGGGGGGGRGESESTGTPPAPTPEELEEQTDSDAELPPPSPSQIAKILLQQVFTRLAAKGETTEDVQKSQSDDASKWEAGPGVEVEEQQTITQSTDARILQACPAVEVEEQHTTRWVCVRRSGMDIRSGPYVQRTDVAGYLPAQKVFHVSEERRGLHGTIFLKLADGTGWVFSETRSGTFCKPADAQHAEMEWNGQPWTCQEKDNRGWKDHHEKSWSGSSDYENKVWWTADKDDLDRPKNGGWDYREKRSWSGSSDSKTSGWWMGKEQGGWNSRDPWAQWQKNQY